MNILKLYHVINEIEMYIPTFVLLFFSFAVEGRVERRERRARNVQIEDFMEINILFLSPEKRATQPTSLIFLPSNV